MRRVLVPLDGSSLAASILPDPKQLAGEGGELILIRDPIGSDSESSLLGLNEEASVQETIADLEAQADRLRKEGIRVETHALVMIDPAHAIDTAIRLYGADMVACSTHGRGPLGRLMHGGVVWRALADSPVPVLVRHLDAPSNDRSIFVPERRIMVPLDGSQYAEQALPLAQELAHEWDASIWLVHVVSSYPVTGLPRTDIDPEALSDEQAQRSVQSYLEQVATRLNVKVHKHVLFGPVSEHLVAAVQAWNIGHVVMTSHGKTGLQRALLGSVADNLIQHLNCAIIVIPSHVVAATERSGADQATAGVVSV
jgi:nucleotide-binding universal stress UspA family protein